MSASIDELLHIMRRLRDPDRGCPWDVQQDFASIAPYTIEEAYEVSEAIHRGDPQELCEELGDLLLQVVFHAQMASETGAFDFADVVAGICRKMIERHPHVFETGRAPDAARLREAWETHKEGERRRKRGQDSAVDGVALALPALLRAQKLLKRAARKGFEWPPGEAALARCREALAEVEAAADGGAPRAEEIGDLLLACTAAARHSDVDAEQALRQANRRFEARFRRMESALRDTRREPGQAAAEEMRSAWRQAGP